MNSSNSPVKRPVLSFAQIQAKNRAAEDPKNMALTRIVVNSASSETYTGNRMDCTRPAAGQTSPNGRSA